MSAPLALKTGYKTSLRLAWMIGLSFLLAACANTSRQESERAQSVLLGLSKTALMSCAGVPDKKGISGSGKEYFAYSSEKTVYVPNPYYGPSFYPGFGFGNHHRHFHHSFHYYGGDFTQKETRICTATFGMQNGRVVSLSYILNDNDSLGMKQCYQIVQNCLPAPLE